MLVAHNEKSENGGKITTHYKTHVLPTNINRGNALKKGHDSNDNYTKDCEITIMYPPHKRLYIGIL